MKLFRISQSIAWVTMLLVSACVGEAPTLLNNDAGLSNADPIVTTDLIAQGPGEEFGEALPESHPEQAAALRWVNYYRAKVDLPPLMENTALDAAASGHASFVSAHASLYQGSLSLHEEIPGLPGFIGTKFWDRIQTMAFGGDALGEVISTQPTASAAIAQWMETVYHRIPLLLPHAREMGYGTASDGINYVSVLEVGGTQNSEQDLPIAYPPDGAIDVPASWDGNESPQPPAPKTGYPSGPIFTLTFPQAETILVNEHLLVAADGSLIPHQLLTPDEDPFLTDTGTLAVYGDDPLEPDEMYTVHLEGWRGTQPFVWSSSFKTAPGKACSPLDGECGAGKACYISSNGPTCSWQGVVQEGDSCAYQNDCAIGTSCVENVCRRLCLAHEFDNIQSCDALCPQGYTYLSKPAHFGACIPPQCTPGQNDCGENEACHIGAEVICGSPGTLPEGTPCNVSSDCSKGLGCVDIGDDLPVCRSLCDAAPLAGTPTQPTPSKFSPCNTVCPDAAAAVPEHPGIGVCLQH